jgi:hypothetical protein
MKGVAPGASSRFAVGSVSLRDVLLDDLQRSAAATLDAVAAAPTHEFLIDAAKGSVNA